MRSVERAEPERARVVGLVGGRDGEGRGGVGRRRRGAEEERRRDAVRRQRVVARRRDRRPELEHRAEAVLRRDAHVRGDGERRQQAHVGRRRRDAAAQGPAERAARGQRGARVPERRRRAPEMPPRGRRLLRPARRRRVRGDGAPERLRAGERDGRARARVVACVRINRWFGTSRPNF